MEAASAEGARSEWNQRGSRNPSPPDALAFCLRYSAKVPSARFSSETDLYSRAILIDSQNEASI